MMQARGEGDVEQEVFRIGGKQQGMEGERGCAGHGAWAWDGSGQVTRD